MQPGSAGLLLCLLCLVRLRSGSGSAQCFQCIHPPPDVPYELDDSEYDELHVLFNINCEPLPFAESMTVQSDSVTNVITFEEWQTEHYEMTITTSRRGVQTWTFALVRAGNPAEVETVKVVLGLQRLFSPRVLIAFPPPGFVFYKGVGPFWKINIEEDEEQLGRLGLGSWKSYELEERLDNLETGQVWTRHYNLVNLAYIDGSIPDGEYNLTLTAHDSLGRSYPPGTTITIRKDSSAPYRSRTTHTDLTACPPVQPGRAEENGGADAERCSRCVHGVCVAGACLCEADWFGEACDQDVHDTEVYLPPIDPASTWWACRQARHFREGVQQLHDLILRVQFPVDPEMCGAGDRLGGAGGGGTQSAGLQAFHADTTSAFGVNLRSLAIALGRSLQVFIPRIISVICHLFLPPICNSYPVCLAGASHLH